MATIRVQKNSNYVVLNNTALEDPNLSFKAKGIFAYLMSKPDDWSCQVKDLQKHSKDGRDSIYNGLKELREHGYMLKRPIKNEKNIIVEWEELLFEVPQDEAKKVFKEQQNKRSISGKSVCGKKVKNSTSGKPVSGKSVSGKPVNIINTNIPNTNIPNTNTSSSSNAHTGSLVELFQENICALKTTTSVKFANYIECYNADFILAVVEYCAEISIRSFAGFKKVIDTYIGKGIVTRNEFILSVENYRANKKAEHTKTTPNKNYKNKIVDKFNDYEQREYTQDEWRDIENSLSGTDIDIDGESLLKKILESRKKNN